MVATAAAVGLVAAGAAGCADSEAIAPTTSAQPAAVAELISQGSLVRGRGAASALLTLQPLLLADELRADGWQVVVEPSWQPLESCIRAEPEALDDRAYIQGAERALQVSVRLYRDEATARDELAFLRDEAAECWNSAWSALREGYEAFDLPAPDEGTETMTTVEPFVDLPGSFTRRSVFDTTLGPVDIHSSVYLIGPILVQVAMGTVGAEPSPEQHRATTAGLYELQRRAEIELVPDPTIDQGVARLRSITPDLASDPVVPLPPGTTPGRWDVGQLTTTEERCGVAATTGLYGPIWNWPLQNYLTQVGWTHADETAAEAEVAALAAADPACWFDTDARWWIRDSTFRQGSHQLIEVDGRSIAVVDITVDADLFGTPATMRTVHAITAVGSDTVGWIFRGLDGDQPDVPALTAELASRLEGG